MGNQPTKAAEVEAPPVVALPPAPSEPPRSSTAWWWNDNPLLRVVDVSLYPQEWRNATLLAAEAAESPFVSPSSMLMQRLRSWWPGGDSAESGGGVSVGRLASIMMSNNMGRISEQRPGSPNVGFQIADEVAAAKKRHDAIPRPPPAPVKTTERVGTSILEHNVMSALRDRSFFLFAASTPLLYLMRRRSARLDLIRRRQNPDHAEVPVLDVVQICAAGSLCATAAATAVVSLRDASKRYLFTRDVVRAASVVRRDPVIRRWSNTTGRLMSMGAVVTVLFSNAGPAYLRFAAGASLGAMLSGPVCWSDLDLAVSLATGG